MTTTNPTIPDELSNIVYSLDFEDEGGFNIKAVQSSSNALIINFITYIGTISDTNSINGEWTLQVKDVVEHNIEFGWEGEFEYYDSHPLLLTYNEPKASLFFSSEADDKNKLVSDLYQAHTEICKGFIDIEQFLNHSNLVTQCFSSYGLFACGPTPLIEKYHAVLDNHKMKCNILQHHKAKSGIEDAYFLLTLGESYFIGKEFNFQKIA